MYYIPLVCGIIALLTTIFATRWFIRYARVIGLTVKDQNKEDTPLIPLSGGLAVMAGLFMGINVFIFFDTFLGNNFDPYLGGKALTFLFAALTSIIMITFVGFVDDLMVRKDKESSAGLKQWQKPLLTLVAAIPLMVVNVGITTLQIPFLGRVDVGILYPLVLVPIGVVGAANMVNMLAGFNGLESGMGLVYTGMLSLYAFFNGRNTAALIAFMTFCALLAFFYFNKFPAKIFPGDSLTYLLGGVIASVAIIGNIEKAALIASIPFLVEALLKWRGGFNVKSFGYYKDGKIHSHHDKIYSLPHLFTITGKFTERQVVNFLILIELFFSSLIWIL
jgi:UDP-N-acetylglucosamine--dolichyl-phosphate N-acetylglucosaminephosphotransferase